MSSVIMVVNSQGHQRPDNVINVIGYGSQTTGGQ